MAFDPSTYKLKEQPGSGSKTGAGKVQFVFAGLRSTGKDASAWEALKTDADNFTQFRGYYIDLDSCRLDYSAGMWILYIAGNETSGSTVTTRPAVGETRYNLTLEYSTVPLETLDKFKMRWSYDLFYAVDTDEENPTIPAIPSAVEEATDSLTGNYAGVWAYAKSQPANFTKLVEGELHTFAWTLVARREKGNISGKMVFTACVNETKYYRSRSAAISGLPSPNSFRTPGQTFGFTGGQWICQPDGISEEGNLWVSHTKYLYSKEWDEDLYP